MYFVGSAYVKIDKGGTILVATVCSLCISSLECWTDVFAHIKCWVFGDVFVACSSN